MIKEEGIFSKEIKIQKPSPEFIKDMLDFEMPDIAAEELKIINDFKNKNKNKNENENEYI